MEENRLKRCLKGVIRCSGWTRVLWGVDFSSCDRVQKGSMTGGKKLKIREIWILEKWIPNKKWKENTFCSCSAKLQLFIFFPPIPCSILFCSDGWRRTRGCWSRGNNIVVYYESIKRELKTRPIYECRCDERLKP